MSKENIWILILFFGPTFIVWGINKIFNYGKVKIEK